MYLTAQGIDHPSCPESSNFVRGWNYPCGIFCFPTDKYSVTIIMVILICALKLHSGQKTKAIYIIQSDLRGRLPISLVESSLPSTMVNTFNNLQAAIDAELVAP